MFEQMNPVGESLSMNMILYIFTILAYISYFYVNQISCKRVIWFIYMEVTSKLK
jgi:hypothetical protein